MKIDKILILFATVLLLLLAACGNDESSKNDVELDEESLENITESGLPIVEEPITLKMFAVEPTIPADWNDLYIWNKYEEMTNINVEWEQVPSDSVGEKRNLALSSGNLPDAFYVSGIANTDLFKYGEQGTFIKLNGLIDEYAPNLKKIMEESPEVKKSLTFPDGNIYSMPSLVSSDFLSLRIGSAPWINKTWLDNLGMDIPETTEEFYQYLKAVKEEDPNGNGEADEIPYGGTSIDELIGWLQGSFDVGNKGLRNANIDLDPEENKVRFFPTSENYKELLQYMNKLYSEKLIEQNIISIEWDQYLANASEDLYGSTVFFDPGEDFYGGLSLEGPHGDRGFTKVAPTVASIGNFAITSENPNPAATVRWMDYFYSDEGNKFFYLGVEDDTFEETSDGEFEYTDKVNDSEGDIQIEKYFAWVGGIVGNIKEDYYITGPESRPAPLKAAERLEPYIPEELWPAFTYTKEENKILTSTGSDLDKYVKEMRDKFIVGDASFAEWDDYVKTIEGMGLEDYIKVQQDAFERYKSE